MLNMRTGPDYPLGKVGKCLYRAYEGLGPTKVVL